MAKPTCDSPSPAPRHHLRKSQRRINLKIVRSRQLRSVGRAKQNSLIRYLLPSSSSLPLLIFFWFTVSSLWGPVIDSYFSSLLGIGSPDLVVPMVPGYELEIPIARDKYLPIRRIVLNVTDTITMLATTFARGYNRPAWKMPSRITAGLPWEWSLVNASDKN
jgi:hypothetical protein